MGQLLGPDQPCYGLQLPTHDVDGRPLERIEPMARTLLAEIRQVRPSGPYCLGGYSFGGLVAYEIAQQLVAAGEEVPLLLMWDTFAPGGMESRPLPHRALIHLRRLWRTDLWPAFRSLSKRTWRIVRRRAGPQPSETTGPLAVGNRVREIKRVSRIAFDAYHPEPYPKRVTLLLASERSEWSEFFNMDPLAGWQELARGGVALHQVRGQHLGMFDPQWLGQMAQTVRACLHDAMARTATGHDCMPEQRRRRAVVSDA